MNTTTAENPQQRQITPYEKFRQYVDSPLFKNDLAKLLGNPQKVDRFVRVTLTATQANPELLNANRRTLLLACMKAASDNLMPDGKEAVFNVYNTKVKKKNDGGNVVETWEPHVQYLPMVGGIVKKMYGLMDYDGKPMVLRVTTGIVHRKDQFSYELGDEPKIFHKPDTSDEPGEITHAYASIKLNNGEFVRAVMTKEQIEKTRQQSKAPDSLMWKQFYDQGCRKAVLKRAAKDMPSSVELERVIAADNEATGLEHGGAGLHDPMDESGSTVIQLTDQRDEQAERTVTTEVKKEDKALARREGRARREEAGGEGDGATPERGSAIVELGADVHADGARGEDRRCSDVGGARRDGRDRDQQPLRRRRGEAVVGVDRSAEGRTAGRHGRVKDVRTNVKMACPIGYTFHTEDEARQRMRKLRAGGQKAVRVETCGRGGAQHWHVRGTKRG
jgi:recombination protein RecT